MSQEFKLVPVEPTAKMIAAGMEMHGFTARYKAMIAAAPQPPALGGEPEPFGWVVGSLFYKSRSIAIAHAEKTPCIGVYSRASLAPYQAEIDRLGLKADSLEFAKWSCQVNQEAIRLAGHETIDDLAAERDQLAARVAELEGLLRRVHKSTALPKAGALWQQIDAALSKPTEGAQS